MTQAVFGRSTVMAMLLVGCGSAQRTAASPPPSAAAQPAAAGSLAADQAAFRAAMARGQTPGATQADTTAAFRAARAAAERHPAEMWTSFAEASLALANLVGVEQPGPGAQLLEAALELTDKLSAQDPQAKRVYQQLDAKYAELREREWRSEHAHRLELYGGAARQVDAAGAYRSITPQEALLPPRLPPSPDPRAGEIAGAIDTTASMRKDFQRCYVKALTTNPQARGDVWVKIEVGGGGAVNRASAVGRGLPESALDCILRQVTLTRFAEPVGGRGALTLPLTFSKS